MGPCNGFLRGSSGSTPSRKNLLCLQSRLLSSARLRRLRLVTVTVTSAVTVTTRTAVPPTTVLACRLHRLSSTWTTLGSGYGTTPAVTAVTAVTTAPAAPAAPAAVAVRASRALGPAPQSVSRKPCIPWGARPSLLSAQAYDYYTTTRSSPVLLTPRETEPHVLVPARVSSFNPNSSLFASQNPNSFQVQPLLFRQPGFSRSFSTSSSTMTAVKLDGTAIAKSIREKLAAEVVEKQQLNPQYQPSLRIVQGWFAAASLFNIESCS